MKPVHCRVLHDPENGKYGDCLRACIASLLELDADDVPHFHHDDPGGEEANRRMYEFLEGRGYVPFWSFFDGGASLDEILNAMQVHNFDVYYLLYHKTMSEMDHVVICKGGVVDFNPAWYPTTVAGPNSSGAWGVMVIALK